MADKNDAKETEGAGVLGFLRESAIVIIGALVASTLLRMFLVQVFMIPSGSMENTLLIKDRVAVEKVVPFQRGDIVVFKDDNGWLATGGQRPTPVQEVLQFVGLLPDDSQNYLIKRAIGLPGDHVKCCDQQGRVTVNGTALDEGAYLFTDTDGQQVKPSDFPFDVVVPEGKIFVMGDHRNDSADSRCHLAESNNGVLGGLAFVNKSSVVGAGLAVVFPFDRWKGLGRPATFAGVPAATGTPPAAPVITGDPPHC